MDDPVGDFPNPEAAAVAAVAAEPPIAPKNAGPFFERTDWLSFGLTTLLALTVYLFTLSPSIDLEFSGIFTTGALYGGVPHPPGFPLWTLYAHLFTVLLPFSNIAWRVSVSSAIAAAVANGLIALLVSRGGLLILENLQNFQRLEPKQEKWLRIVSGYAAGMTFGLSGAVWSKAVIPDRWPVSFALFAGLCCGLLKFGNAPQKNRYLFFIFGIYGLALTNSQSLAAAAPGLLLYILFLTPAIGRDLLAATTLLLIPVIQFAHNTAAPMVWRIYLTIGIVNALIALALVFKTRRLFTHWKTVLGCFIFLGLGLSVYFYSPLASMTNPPMNWGYPRTVEGFFHLISRGQYERIYPVDELTLFWMELYDYFKLVGSDYGWPHLLLAAAPFFFWRRMRSTDRKIILGMLALFLCESFFLLALLNPTSDLAAQKVTKSFYAPSFLILALWTGFGLVLLGSLATRPKNSGLAVVPKPASL